MSGFLGSSANRAGVNGVWLEYVTPKRASQEFGRRGSKMISGRTTLIAHLGYPTETFTAPMIYNPWFAARGIDAVVVPMGVKADDYAALLRPLFRLGNI